MMRGITKVKNKLIIEYSLGAEWTVGRNGIFATKIASKTQNLKYINNPAEKYIDIPLRIYYYIVYRRDKNKSCICLCIVFLLFRFQILSCPLLLFMVTSV